MMSRLLRAVIWAWLLMTISSRTRTAVDWSTIDQSVKRFSSRLQRLHQLGKMTESADYPGQAVDRDQLSGDLSLGGQLRRS